MDRRQTEGSHAEQQARSKASSTVLIPEKEAVVGCAQKTEEETGVETSSACSGPVLGGSAWPNESRTR